MVIIIPSIMCTETWVCIKHGKIEYFANWVRRLTSVCTANLKPFGVYLNWNPPTLGRLTLSAHFMEEGKDTWTRYMC